VDIKIKKNSNDVYLVVLSGALDLRGSNQLKDLVLQMIKNKVERFIISLADVDIVSSEGIGALIYTSSTLRKLKYPLVIVVPDGPVIQALESARLKSYFAIASSLKEATLLLEAQL
jgi:anti-anti-sigma factor